MARQAAVGRPTTELTPHAFQMESCVMYLLIGLGLGTGALVSAALATVTAFI